MSSITETLRQAYLDEVADIRRVTHYNNPKLDLEEILKKDVRLAYVSNHYRRFVVVTRLFDGGMLETGEEYFYASFILSQEEELSNQALGYMLALSSKRMDFLGNSEVPDMDEYIGKLGNSFHTRMTGLE
ncbi:MAG: hypothetical protein AAB381_03060 [Patescibacteria group bacterium]